MSLETAHANPNAPSAAAATGRNAALRIAFGAVIGFLLAGAFQITLFFPAGAAGGPASLADGAPSYVFVSVQSGPVFFLLVVLLVGLMLGGWGVVAGPKAPIYAVAFVSFIILLGLGVSPAPGETAVYFVDRLVSGRLSRI
jgi:hypothetical protein